MFNRRRPSPVLPLASEQAGTRVTLNVADPPSLANGWQLDSLTWGFRMSWPKVIVEGVG
jgi:hypothetical protein